MDLGVVEMKGKRRHKIRIEDNKAEAVSCRAASALFGEIHLLHSSEGR
jgi:hypothetical protein